MNLKKKANLTDDELNLLEKLIETNVLVVWDFIEQKRSTIDSICFNNGHVQLNIREFEEFTDGKEE